MKPAGIHLEPKLAGKRILILEDEFLSAVWLESIVRGWGCIVVGPASNLAEAQRLTQSEVPHGAILDINIQGSHSGEIAEQLGARGCPFLFVTGYSSPGLLPEHLRSHPRLYKPVDERLLFRAASLTFAGASDQEND